MTTVSLGSNLFVDCETLIGIRDTELLRVSVRPLRVTLTTPTDLPSRRVIRVVENEARGNSPDVRVIATEKSVAIFWRTMPALIATLVEEDTVNLRADLRPVGISLYEDGGLLHIGSNTFGGNLFRGNKVGIRLG